MTDLKRSILGAIAKKIRAYHGTPHDFDKFDLQKMGTGEGAQTFGDGLYFAEEPKVAEHYKNVLRAEPKLIYSGPPHPGQSMALSHLKQALDGYDRDYDPIRALGQSRASAHNTLRDLRRELGDMSSDPSSEMLSFKDMITDADHAVNFFDRLDPKHLSYVPPPPSKMYTVDIHGDPITDFIDLDKNLVHQPEIMRKAESVADRYKDHSSGMDDVLRLLGRATAKPARELIPGSNPRSPLSYRNKPVNTGEGPRGRELYDALHRGLGPIDGTDDLLAWAEAMKERGLFGNRYKDEFSRFQAKLGENEESTHNYVVWDPDRIDIVDKKFRVGPV